MSSKGRRNQLGAGDTEPSIRSNPAIELAKDEFQSIYEDVSGGPPVSHHVQLREQLSAYTRLMAHLDGLEKNQFKWCRRAAALAVFLGLTSALVCFLTVEPADHWRLLKQRVWQWVTMGLMVTGVFSVVPFVTSLASWPAKRYWKTGRYAVYFIRGMKRSADVTIWSCIVLIGWYLWFRRRFKHVYGDVSVVVVSQVTRFLIALCIGSLLWSIKNALYLKLEADLHYCKLFKRITRSVVYLNGLNVLKGKERIQVNFLAYRTHKKTPFWEKLIKIPFRMVLPRSKSSEEDNQSNNNHFCSNIWMDVKKMEREKVPIWILHRLTEEFLGEVKLLRPPNAQILLKDDEQLLKEAKGMFHQIVPNHDCSEISRDDLSNYGLSNKELEILFKKKRYENLGSAKYMQKKDEKVIGINQEARENEKSKLKPQGEENEIQTPQEDKIANNESETPTKKKTEKEMVEKPIHKDDFINWAVRAHKNCWSLEQTLESSKTAFVKLNRMLNAFLTVLMVIIWLLLSKIVTTAQLALLFAPFLAASFMFQNSSVKMFHGIIFAFAMHPFDVGDRVIIENIQMRVKEMKIMTSVFIKYDNGAEVIFPNSKLVNTKIVNLDITPDQSDILEFIIKADTPLEDIKDLELKIKKLLDDHLFYSSETKVVKSSYPAPESKNELKMTVHFKYLVSYLTADIKATRKSEILSMIMKFRKEMEENKKDFLLEDHVVYHLEHTTPNNVKLSGIDYMKQEKGYEYCKVVMTDVSKKDNKLKMALFVRTKEDMLGEVFNDMDNSLLECGFTDLNVSKGEESVYPKWKEAWKKLSWKELQGNNPINTPHKDVPPTSTATAL